MIRLIALAAPAALLLAACGSSGGGGTTSSAPPSSSSSSAAAGGGAVTISLTSGGVLVGPDGHTLYSNTADTATHLICTGSCLTIWPPVEGAPTAGSGVSSADLGTIHRGTAVQVTYQGHPLYEFKSDMAAGDERGAGLTDQGGTWHPAAAAASPAPSSPASHGGGYGYP